LPSDSRNRHRVRAIEDVPEPAGFGNCGTCAYKLSGTIDTCFDCAKSTLDELAPDRCNFCEGRLSARGRCGNPLCNRPVEKRGWEFIWAVSTRTGALKRAISAYKYDGKWGWAYIFGRVLVGYLATMPKNPRDEYGVIIPMPTYVGPGGRNRDHIADILKRAQIEDPAWPFRFDVMTKTRNTPKLVDQPTFYDRARVAEREIGPALKVLEPDAVRGKHVLVFDDVFTGGLTLREVARKLLAANAKSVDGLVLARQPFQG
jgi:predicted amidophosphoribosyltransferase